MLSSATDVLPSASSRYYDATVGGVSPLPGFLREMMVRSLLLSLALAIPDQAVNAIGYRYHRYVVSMQ